MNTSSTNPLLERARIPGETFTLPSQGLFYKNNELSEDVKDGEVYIYPMTTIDELIFKTPDKLFSGEAITEVFSRCIPNVLQPMELLAKDVDFLLVCLRRVTYGEHMEITYNHDCSEDAKVQDYRISMSPFINESKRVDPTTMDESYTITLENKQIVCLSPPKFKHVLKMYQSVANAEVDDIEELQKDINNTLVGMIKSVDGLTDPKLILEWVETISAGWIKEMNKQIEEASNWGPDFLTKVKCKDCGEDIDISTPINPLAFFI